MINWLKGLFGKRPVSTHPSYDNSPAAQRRRSFMRAILRTYNRQPKGIRRGTVEWARFVYLELMAVERVQQRVAAKAQRLLKPAPHHVEPRPSQECFIPLLDLSPKRLTEEEWDKATDVLLDAHKLTCKAHRTGSLAWAASVLAGLEARGYSLRKDP